MWYCSFKGSKTEFGAISSWNQEVYFPHVMSRSEVKEERNFADHLNAVTNDNEIIQTLNCIDIMRAFTEVKT